MGAAESRPFNYEQQLLSPASAKSHQSVEVEDAQGQPANASMPRRANAAKDGLITVPFPDEGGCETIWGCFQRGVRKFPNNPCFGTRKYETDGKKYKLDGKLPLRGDYVWESYAEVNEVCVEFGCGLLALGAKAGSNIGLFSGNRAEWMISALAFYSQNMRVVSLYASLGENAVEYIINHADVNIVCVSKSNLAALFKSAANLKGVTHIIQFDVNDKYNNIEETVDEADVERAKGFGIQLLGFSQVRGMGAAKKDELQPQPAAANDVAYIMYTSGTTGNPKGAILLHSNICATVACVPYIFPLSEKDSYLSYLPLAHIFETIAQVAVLVNGGAVGFFQDNIKKLTLDMQAVQPSLFCGVPRVFTRIYQVVMNGVSEKSCIVRWYFNKAFNHQCDRLRQGLPLDPKYDEKVFAPLRARMGLSRARFVVTGAAPMPPYLAEFLKVVTNCPVLEGYGMTEASAATSITMVNDPNLGHTGPPVPCCEVRLEDIPDMGYLHTDANPRGEICVRGPAVFSGYWKDAENTRATIIDGWLHTGDVGRFNPNGTLSIIDRKKNMFKLSQGEYIAAEKIEQVYQKSPVVGQIWVYGNSFKSFLLAVVVPAAETTAAYLAEKGWWPNSDVASTKLASDTFSQDFKTAMTGEHAAEIKAWIVDQLRVEEGPLKGFEKVSDFIIECDIDRMGMGFTESNECLTPTFKMRRPQLLQRYIKQLKQMYADKGEPVGADEKWPGEP